MLRLDLCRGFSLLEIVLVVGAVGLFAVIGLPAGYLQYARYELRLETVTLNELFIRARQRAIFGQNAVGAWSVYVTATSATLFSGTTYPTRNTAYDEYDIWNGSVTATATPNPISFATSTGRPIATGTIVLTSSVGDKATITVDYIGDVHYSP